MLRTISLVEIDLLLLVKLDKKLIKRFFLKKEKRKEKKINTQSPIMKNYAKLKD